MTERGHSGRPGPRSILYVIQHREFSGAETAQAAVIAADPDALVACPPGSPSENFALRLGARTVELPFRPLRHSGGRLEILLSVIRGLQTVLDLRRLLRQHNERRAIYAIGIRAGLLSSLAAVALGRSVVWNVPDRLPPRPLRGPVRLLASYGAVRAICLSEFIAADLRRNSRRLASRSVVVHPGVDLQRLDSGGAEPGAPVAAIVGHISSVKRTALAIDTAELIVGREPGFRLRIVGEAQFREEDVVLECELRRRVAAHPGLRRAVEFAGRQRGIGPALGGCGLLLHCRADEPFGMVLIEAMAMGIPVVAPASGGPLEIVKDGVTGFLYRPEEPGHAAECVRCLLGDPELARSMGAAGRRRAESAFSAPRQVKKTTQLLAGASG